MPRDRVDSLLVSHEDCIDDEPMIEAGLEIVAGDYPPDRLASCLCCGLTHGWSVWGLCCYGCSCACVSVPSFSSLNDDSDDYYDATQASRQPQGGCCRGKLLLIAPRTKQSRCCSCRGALLCFTMFIVIFFLVAFWDCLALSNEHLGSVYMAPPDSQTSAAARAASGLVNVLSFNVFLRMSVVCGPVTCTQHDYREGRMQELIARMDDYDVLLLQETWLILDLGRKKRLVDALVDKGFYYWRRSRNPSGGQFNDGMLLMMSRHPMTHASELSYTETTEGQKGALYSRVTINGLPSCQLDVFTTHMQSVVPGREHIDADVQKAQQYELAAWIEDKKRALVPGILTGDFNYDGRTSATDGTPSEKYYELLVDLQPPRFSLAYSFEDMIQAGTGGVVPVTYLHPLLTGSNLLEPEAGWNVSEGEGLDYVFMLRPNASFVPPNPSSSSSDADQTPSLVTNNGYARVREMRVTGQEFTQVSDHFAVSMQLHCPL